MMKKLLLLIFITSFSISFAQQQYYSDVDLTLTGIQLKQALAVKVIATHVNELTYTPGIWEASKITDLNPENSAEVLLIYGYENGTDSNGDNDRTRGVNVNGGGQGEWNREHVYARSLGNPNLDFVGPGADVHNLRPSDANLNSARSNRKFGKGSGNAGFSSDTYGAGNTVAWYPGDEWKGDVARMMMYMYIRYGDQCLASGVGLGDSQFTPDDMIDLFLQWNVEDPVSDFERQRNTYHGNTSNTYAQGNRNPFIDNAYLATRIWGGDSAIDSWGIYTSSDTEAPSMPTNVTITENALTSLKVSWNASTDNVGVSGYNVFVDGVLTEQTSNTTVLITGLNTNTSYSFTVVAKDIVNNQSNASSAVNGTTLADTEAPSTPTLIVISNESDSSFKVSWTQSTDNNIVSGYEVYVDDSLNATTTDVSYTVTGLALATNYSVQILAIDADNNRSSKSAPVIATTKDGNTGGVAGELFFSEYIEGSGNNKAIEIVNLTGTTVSLAGYSIKRQQNGGGDWITPVNLDRGDVKNIIPNDVFVIINSAASLPKLQDEADLIQTNTEADNYGAPINFNGNDPVGLFKNDVLIDIIGVFNGGSSDFAKDVNLLRKSTITAPTTSFNFNEWNSSSDLSTYADLGKFTSTLSATDNALNTFKIYPNPVNGDLLYISSTEELKINIYNVLGKLLKTQTVSSSNNSINVKNLNAGVYILKVTSGTKSSTKKFIKN